MAIDSPKHSKTASVSAPERQLCFVIGPIGKPGSTERKHADLLLQLLIKHVLETEEFGYRVKRADEDADPGMIGDRMISDIVHAQLVVADLTDLNPNAFYELGIRHSKEAPTIHVARSGTELPFDNAAHRTIFVDLGDWQSIENARRDLAAITRFINSPGYRVSNPITQANASFHMRESSDPRDRIWADVQERLAHIEAGLVRRAGNASVAHRAISATHSAKVRILENLEKAARQMLEDNSSSETIRINITRLAQEYTPHVETFDVKNGLVVALPDIGSIEIRSDGRTIIADSWSPS